MHKWDKSYTVHILISTIYLIDKSNHWIKSDIMRVIDLMVENIFVHGAKLIDLCILDKVLFTIFIVQN